MTTFAVALQIYTLAHSSVAVGAVGLVSAVPAIALGPLGLARLTDSCRRRWGS